MDWLRKNSFVKDIRKFLKRFRIVEIKTEAYGECHEVENTEGIKRWGSTGRDVVIIKLIGYWRQK